jgi:hypothetical protein
MAINVTKTNGTIAAPVTPAMDIQAIIANAVAQGIQAATAPMAAEVARLKAENAKLAATPVKVATEVPLTCRVSLKGAVSVYGLGRFPVTLYESQWRRLIKFFKSLETFLDANKSSLKSKE